MATVARHIRSHYDPETEREELLLETGQALASGHGRVRGGIGFSSDVEEGGNVDGDNGQEEGIDPWLVELPYASDKLHPPVKFVKSILSYEDVNDYIERGYESGLPGRDEEKDEDMEKERRGISNWYRNLSRTNVSTPAPPPVHETSTMAERTAKTGTFGYSVPSSGVTDGSAATTPQRTSEQPPTLKPPSPPQGPLQPQPQPSNNPRRRNDWFISNVLPQSSPTASSPNSPAPGLRAPPTLADILARDPPPNKSQEVYTPPTWIMLPPSNPGFRMLQKSGWSEGEPLGPYFARRQGVVQPERQPVAGPSNLRRRETIPDTRTMEIKIEGYDDIVEIKKEQIIDLTVSDDEESAWSNDGYISDEAAMELDDETLQLSNGSLNPTSARPLPPRGEGHGGKALLTPLPTVLKSDRLGIGLKAKTVGPYKASQKRVTHNAAALTAHVKANEERKLFKQKVGRGSRGFARAEKRDREKRKGLLAYLNQ